jgi:hypothetical protein
MSAKPVDLPPPKLVLKPKAKTRSGVHLYILAIFSRISVLGTEDLGTMLSLMRFLTQKS